MGLGEEEEPQQARGPSQNSNAACGANGGRQRGAGGPSHNSKAVCGKIGGGQKAAAGEAQERETAGQGGGVPATSQFASASTPCSPSPGVSEGKRCSLDVHVAGTEERGTAAEGKQAGLLDQLRELASRPTRAVKDRIIGQKVHEISMGVRRR